MPNQIVPQVQASTSEFTYVYGSGSSIVVDAGVTITQPANSFPLDGIHVTVLRNFTSGDKLSIGGSTETVEGDKITYTGGTVPAGVTATYDTTNGVLKCVSATSNAYQADTWQSIARAVEFSSTADSDSDTSRDISFTLGEKQALQVTLNGSTKPHYYEFIPTNPEITWTDARAAASNKTFFGLRGYLACISSEEENTFVKEKIRQPNGNIPKGWLGGTDDPTAGNTTHGTWKWVDGPEAGSVFRTNNDTPSGSYANWQPGQPDNWHWSSNAADIGWEGRGVGEHYLHFIDNGCWNDLTNNGYGPSEKGAPYNRVIAGYVVEYGGYADDPVLTISTNVTINLRNENNAVAEQLGLVDDLLHRVDSLTYSVIAPRGPVGAAGAVGPAGDVGAPGAPGVDGTPGVDGERGPSGARGVTGAQGDRGEQGAQGIAGVDGAQGIRGAQGSVGPMGPVGDVGEDGVQGESGPVGEAGPVGETGPVGLDGRQGPQGPQGFTGPSGDHFDGESRLIALEDAITTREDAIARINSSIVDGISEAETNIIRDAIDDTLVTSTEMEQGFADVDARLDCLEARMAAVANKMSSKRVLVVKQLNFSFDC